MGQVRDRTLVACWRQIQTGCELFRSTRTTALRNEKLSGLKLQAYPATVEAAGFNMRMWSCATPQRSSMPWHLQGLP